MKKSSPRILFFDIEISPNVSYTWPGKYELNVIAFKKEWEIMSIAWKWEGEKTRSLCNGDIGDKDDRKLCIVLHGLLDEADVVVGQNSDAFDIKKAKVRFLYHGLPPVKKLCSIDTKKIAKREFSFNSNSLDDLGNYLGVGRKIKHEGFDLWLKCLAGDKEAWRKMKLYNANDVDLLYRVYQKLKPWTQNHPNIALMSDVTGCPNCGHTEFGSHGIRYTQTRKYRRLVCKSCGANFKGSLVK